MGTTTKKYQQLLEKKDSKVLGIHDQELLIGGILLWLKENLSIADIKIIKDIEYYNIEKVLEQYRPDIVIVGSRFKKYPIHPEFELFGNRIVPYIRDNFPDVYIIFVSLAEVPQVPGADMQINLNNAYVDLDDKFLE